MDNKEFTLHLEQEIAWLDELNALLTVEKDILINRQFDQLEELANKKQLLSDNLENSAKRRIDFIQSSNSQHTSLSNGLTALPKEDSLLISELNKTLSEKLNLCRELNTINGQVIANNLHARQEIIHALSGNASHSVGVYNANGNITSTTDKGHHQEA